MLQGTSSRETRDAAREIKFLVTPAQAAQVLEWASARLAPDPYAGGPSGDEYQTTTLYFDTEDLAVFRRRGSYRRSKYRIRRYGSAEVAFLERKLRTATLLSKRRTAVALDELARVDEAVPDPTWAGHWFVQRLVARRLAPVCQVSYHRHARVGTGAYGPLRLTFDNEILVQPCHGIHFEPTRGLPVLGSGTIIEMKYCVEIPGLLKELVETFGLSPAAISKYRLSMERLREAGATTGVRRLDLRELLGTPGTAATARIVNA